MIKRYGYDLYVFLLALFSSIVGAVLLSWPIFAGFINIENLTQKQNLSFNKIFNNYNQLMDYLINPFNKELKMSDFPSSKNGLQHFSDVKRLLLIAISLFVIIAIIELIRMFFRRKLWVIKSDMLILAIIPVILLGTASLNFDQFFIAFHHLLFTNSNWLFDPATDPVINILSENFFATVFFSAFVVYELVILFVYQNNKLKKHH